MSLSRAVAMDDMRKVLAQIENRKAGYRSAHLTMEALSALLRAQIVMMQETEEKKSLPSCVRL